MRRLRVWAARYSGEYARGLRVIAARDEKQAIEIAKRDDNIPSCCGFDALSILPGVTADFPPRVLVGESYAE